MSKPRKRWSAIRMNTRTKFGSEAATYRWVRQHAEFWQQGMLSSPLITVYVDERDGQGWQTFERIDLREFRRDVELTDGQ